MQPGSVLVFKLPQAPGAGELHGRFDFRPWRCIVVAVAEDTAFKNAHRNSDRENARIEHDRALLRVMTSMMKDDNQLFKQFMDNDGFKRWMTDTVFDLTTEQADAA